MTAHRPLFGSAALVVALALSARADDGPAPADPRPLVIEGAQLVRDAEAAPLAAGRVVLRAGRVVAVGEGVAVPADARVDRYPGAWVVPGFVDLSSARGLVGDRDEVAAPLETDVLVAPPTSHRDFAAARAAGITTCAVLPGDADLFGGAGPVLKTSGAQLGWLLKLSVGDSALRPDRAPTSRAGALALLRARVAEVHERSDDPGALARFARGDLPALVHVEGVAEARAVLELAGRYGLDVVLHLGPSFAVEDLEVLDLSGRLVALGPLDPDLHPRVLRLSGALAAAGARPCFVSDAPARADATLRLSAALAVRYGLDPRAALLGLTRGPAEALGQADRVGTLDVGRDGDAVVFDGPPLALSSRVLAVYVAGERVVSTPPDLPARRTP